MAMTQSVHKEVLSAGIAEHVCVGLEGKTKPCRGDIIMPVNG